MGEQSRRLALGMTSAPTYRPQYTGETIYYRPRQPTPEFFLVIKGPKENAPKCKARPHDRRRREAKQRNPLPPNLVGQLLALQAERCYICASRFKEGLAPTRDHVTPLSRGGGGFGNILLACMPCNNRKGDRPPSLQELSYLRDLYVRLASKAANEKSRPGFPERLNAPKARPEA